MSASPVSRRQFLQLVGATAPLVPFVSLQPRASGPTLRHASIGASGQALSDLKSFATHPSFDLVAVADVDLGRFEPLQQAFPKVRVYQDWRELLEKEHAHIDSVNVSVPDHMHCLIALEAMKRGKAVYVQKPLCNTLREDAAADRAGASPQADDADGHPGVVRRDRSGTARRWSAAASSARSARCTRSRTRAGGTTSRCPRAPTRFQRRFDWDEWLGVLGAAGVQARCLSPGRMAPSHRLRHRDARRHGLPHLQPAVSRAEADVAALGHGVRSRAHRRELGDEGAGEADVSGNRVHRRTDCRRLVVRRRRAAARRRFASRSAPACRNRAASSSAPTGLIVLPHLSARAVRAAGVEDGGAAARSICRSAITTTSSSTSCSAAASRRARPTSTTPVR